MRSPLPFSTSLESPRVPTRAELETNLVSVIRTGRRGNADLYVIDLGEGPMVVKDFKNKSKLVRWIGRHQIGHECRAYKRLKGVKGIPRFIGRIDRHAMAIELVEATQLTYASNRYSDGRRHLESLRQILKDLLDRGFVHLDLRGRRNVMIRPSGELVVLDLAGAIWFRPGSAAYRILTPLIHWNYRNLLFKWKVLLDPEGLSEGERQSLQKFRRMQRLWVFNRKGSQNARWPMDFPRLIESTETKPDQDS